MATLKHAGVWQVLTLAILVGAGAFAQSTGQNGSATGFIQSISLSTVTGMDSSKLYLSEDSGITYRLSFCDGVTVDASLLNTRVTVTYTEIKQGVMYSCRHPSPVENASRRQLYGNEITVPTRPTFLIYIVTLCGHNKSAAATAKDMYNYFNGTGTSAGRTMSTYYDTCSYGQVKMSSSQVRVMEPVEIPCSGHVNIGFTFSTGNNFDTSSCLADNPLKWQFYLDSVAQSKGIVPTNYHHKIMIYPPGIGEFEGCNGIAGSGSVGPWIRNYSPSNNWGTGLVWIAGESVQDLEIIFHELGHNMGMQHASIAGNCGPDKKQDQCDNLCPMGAMGGQAIRCLNPPHLYQLGWGQPFRQLSNLVGGAPETLNLPPQMSGPDNFITVSAPGMAPNEQLYLATRLNVYNYDLPFYKSQDGIPYVTVHTYSGTATSPSLNTFRQAILAADQSFTHASSGVVVSFLGWDSAAGGSARVRVCRIAKPSEAKCYAGYDDNCDGVLNDDDPQCEGHVAPLPQTSPPPPRFAAKFSPPPPPPPRQPPPPSPPPRSPSPPPPSPPPPPPTRPPPRRPPPRSPLRTPPPPPPPLRPRSPPSPQPPSPAAPSPVPASPPPPSLTPPPAQPPPSSPQPSPSPKPPTRPPLQPPSQPPMLPSRTSSSSPSPSQRRPPSTSTSPPPAKPRSPPPLRKPSPSPAKLSPLASPPKTRSPPAQRSPKPSPAAPKVSPSPAVRPPPPSPSSAPPPPRPSPSRPPRPPPVSFSIPVIRMPASGRRSRRAAQ